MGGQNIVWSCCLCHYIHMMYSPCFLPFFWPNINILFLDTDNTFKNSEHPLTLNDSFSWVSQMSSMQISAFTNTAQVHIVNHIHVLDCYFAYVVNHYTIVLTNIYLISLTWSCHTQWEGWRWGRWTPGWSQLGNMPWRGERGDIRTWIQRRVT